MKTYTSDASGRICLGKDFSNKHFKLKLTKAGSLELIPVTMIPESEAWLYQNKEALAYVGRGLEQAKHHQGKPLSFDLEEDDVWLEKGAKGESGKGSAR